MILYACAVCGTWQDVSLAQEFKKAWNAAMKPAPSAQLPEDQGWACPAGHGMMRHVTSKDRIFVRPASIEKIVPIEGGESK
jgi:hypothetical protein